MSKLIENLRRPLLPTRGYLAIALLLVSSRSFAQLAPSSPALRCNDGEITCVATNPGGARYNLGALPSNVSDIQWPVAPVTTSNVTVTTNAQLQSAVATDGAAVTVRPGNYSSVNVSCFDCRFTFETGAVIQGGVTFSGGRIEWLGATVTGGTVNLSGLGDLLIDNMHSYSTGINDFTGQWTREWNRVAIINSTLEGNDWLFYMQRPNGPEFKGRNLILANVRLESTGQLNRFQSVQNMVVVDSIFNSRGTASNGLRLHLEATDVWMRDTTIVGESIPWDQGVPSVVNGIFERLTRYSDYRNPFQGILLLSVNIVIRDSQCYTRANFEAGDTPDIGQATGTNPPYRAWVSLPSAAGVGADH
jgi:hypothetical protein